jgi:hypothetical protein
VIRLQDDRLHRGVEDAVNGKAPEIIIESAHDISLRPAEPIEYDVDQILPAEDAPALAFGPPGSLKSLLVLHLCDVIVTGQPFLGHFKVKKRPTALAINLDAGAKTFRNRVRRISIAEAFDVTTLSAATFNFKTFRELVARYEGGFIAIDCLSAIYNPDHTKDPAYAMREFVDQLRDLFAQYGCGGIVVDHPHRPKEKGEAGDYYGSIQKEATFRTIWSVTAEPADATPIRRVSIACRKLSEGQPFEPVSAVVDFSEDWIRFRCSNAATAGPRNAVERSVLEWALNQPDAFSKNAVETSLNHAHRQADLRRALSALVATSLLVATKRKRGGATLYTPHPSLTSLTNSNEAENLPLSGPEAVRWRSYGPVGGHEPTNPEVALVSEPSDELTVSEDLDL